MAQPPKDSSSDPTERLAHLPGLAAEATELFAAPGSSPGAVEDVDRALIGSRLDAFRIDALLGAGGMGRVYLGWNERLHRWSAVKVIAPELVRSDPSRLEMFHAEARAAARLQHPHIVSIYTLGEDRGFHFLEMEYVDGISVGRRLRDEGPMDLLHSTRLIAQLTRALAAAHEQQLVHGDVKPDNLMLRATSEIDVKLTDFGLARAFQPRQTSAQSRMAGTPNYMAPELFAGAPTSFASDVYALGATWFALVSGNPPFRAETLVDLATAHQKAPVPDLESLRADIPAAMQRLIAAMLGKIPSARPRLDGAFFDELARLESSLVPLPEMVAAAMRSLRIEWAIEGDRFLFDVPLVGGRRHAVRAEVVENAAGGEALFSYWAPCAPADAEHFSHVLELNGRLPFGAISVRPWMGRPYFVIVENQLRATLAPAGIRTAVLELAEAADQLESRITGVDRH